MDRSCMCGGFRRAQLNEKVLKAARAALLAFEHLQFATDTNAYAEMKAAVDAVDDYEKATTIVLKGDAFDGGPRESTG